jgi:hypothetical protein
MTPQQKQLWEKITKEVRDLGQGNLRARELYDEICKIINMSDKVIIAITERENGIEVKIEESAYGNLAIIGLLEKIKLNILDNHPDDVEPPVHTVNDQKYDA